MIQKSHQDYIENLCKNDTELFDCLKEERKRQEETLQMIASENTTWPEVMLAQGSILTNKYAEGYPGRRYYGGCEVVDRIENLAIERVKSLFGCKYANVQPHSGTSANIAVFQAFLKPGDTIMGMSLSCGGHLTHGSKVSSSGKLYNAVHYGVKEEDCLIDYDALMEQAEETKPKLIIAGFSAYPRSVEWAKFREVADKVNAILLCDIAHISGLIASGVIKSPIEYADVITSTTHKTLKGPRSGIIMWNNPDYGKKINSAVFPGVQGGPLMHAIAGKAFAFKKAKQPEFRKYCEEVIKNAKAIADELIKNGVNVVTGGTDSHIVLADITDKDVNGKEATLVLEKIGIIVNQNSVPFDKRDAFKTSGIRIGSPGITSRGMKTEQAREIAREIALVVNTISDTKNEEEIQKLIDKTKARVKELCKEFPLYPNEISSDIIV